MLSFEYYRRLCSEPLFSETGKRQIFEFKLNSLSEAVCEAVAEEGALERFSEGEEIGVDYNRSNLLRFAGFRDGGDEFQIMTGVAMHGFSRGARKRRLPQDYVADVTILITSLDENDEMMRLSFQKIDVPED